MKRFISRTLLFSLPVIILMFTEALMKPTLFTFRHYEGLGFQNESWSFSGWYPNITSKMTSTGGLCRSKDVAIPREIEWNTDELGYRNKQFISDPDVLLIGDSFFQGSGNTQKHCITETLTRMCKENVSVYNMAPSHFVKFMELQEMEKMQKPKWVILSLAERKVFQDIPNSNFIQKLTLDSQLLNKAFMYLDKATRFHSVNWLKARINGESLHGLPGVNGSNMYFYVRPKMESDMLRLKKMSESILRYKNYCDSLGVNFLYIPMPEKSTVYYDKVPRDIQPDFLNLLHKQLNELGINNIHALKSYNNYRKTSDELIYHVDDSHWNFNGTRLMAKEIINTIPLLKQATGKTIHTDPN